MSDSNVAKYKKAWKSGLPETPCGAGSTIENTKLQREWIPKIIEDFEIKTIGDIGAGDLNWISVVKLPTSVKYTGFDLVPRHPDVVEFDLITTVPPKMDLIMCFWVLNHLPEEAALNAIRNIKNSGSKYLMITNTPKWNQDYIEELECIDSIPLTKYNTEIRLIKL